jgi:OOP family OmpA-OmpF porin
VVDNLDRCPNTPANARPVDANGCPVDTDHDGVADYLDRCANTPAGTQVDATGCPVAHELPQAGASLVLRNITFRSGTSVLLPASRTELDNIATALKGIPNSRWEINGYTDNVGAAATNLRLSRARAQSVMRYLIGKGVTASSMTAVGHGTASPVAPNTTAAGRAQNRRVEIKRLQ